MANYDDHREAPYQRTTESFVYKSKLKHGDFYDYSKVEYTHSRNPVVIGCPTHGDFLQKPVHHQLGGGCQKCARAKIGKKISSIAKHKRELGLFDKPKKIKHKKTRVYNHHTTEWFLEKARCIHGDTYDYSKTIYTGTKKKVNIMCRKHGEFSQVAYYHLQNKGCPSCGIDRMRHSQESFLARCYRAHGNRYDYSNTTYNGNHEKVAIKCTKHGVFKQMAMTHMKGGGCAKCAQEENGWSRSRHTKAAERNNYSMIYLIECFSDDERFYKIGITTHKINRRFNGKDCMPYAFNVLCTKSDGAYQDWDNEKLIHRKLKEFKYTPLINFKGSGECFSELDSFTKDFFGVK